MVNKNKTSHLDFKKIVDDYHLIKNIPKVAEVNNTTVHYVKLALKQNNVKAYPTSITNRVDVNAIIDSYQKCRNALKVSKEFKISQSSVLKILHDNKIHVRLYPYTDQELIEAYLKYKSAGKAAEKLNVTEGLILSAMRKNNVDALYEKRVKIGDVFGMLTVIKETSVRYTESGYKFKLVECKCECGNIIEIVTQKLTRNERKRENCGCVHKKKLELSRIAKKEKEDKWNAVLAEREIKKQQKQEEKNKKEREKLDKLPKPGDRNEFLLVVDVYPKEKKLSVLCDCGKNKEIKITNFKKTKSCGCIYNSKKKADPNIRKWYDRWRSMIKRCHVPKTKSYKNYGGRGIKVCDRWREPNGVGCKNYYNDIHNILGPQPSPEHSLDRIDNDGMYEINNMRWATNSEQAKNQRRYLK